MASHGNTKTKGVEPGKTDQAECAICLKVIMDRSDEQEGEDVVFCDGACQRWIHRTCVGLTDPAFDSISQTDDQFLCYQCFVISHTSEIKDLRNTIAALTKEMATLRAMLPMVGITANNLDRGPVRTPDYSGAVTGDSTQATPEPTASQIVQHDVIANQPRIKATPTTKAQSQYDRKFNLVFYGVEECPKGTHFTDRFIRDRRALMSILQSMDPSLTKVSIRDITRMGKYTTTRSSQYNRPLLVKFNEAGNVSDILAKRQNLARNSKIGIKPDMTKEEREVEQVLLRERRSLIDNGTSSKDIKIRGKRLFIGQRLHGTVDDSHSFCRYPTIGDSNSSLDDIANENRPTPNHTMDEQNDQSMYSLTGSDPVPLPNTVTQPRDTRSGD